MIVIPMLGKSTRFFIAGYDTPKYKLPLANGTVFTLAVMSFKSYFDKEPFLFLVRKDYEARQFVLEEVKKMGIQDFRIREFSHDTRGQADTVSLGTHDYDDNVSVLIFNIDTIRHDFIYPKLEDIGDGFLEVFIGEGDGWSFIESGLGSKVLRTSEKERISNLCSNGIYYFTRIADFREAFNHNQTLGKIAQGEIYVAPLYNYLITMGRDIRFQLVNTKLVDHCGVPKDYKSLKHREFKR